MFLPSFGRRKTHNLSYNQEELVNNLLPLLDISSYFPVESDSSQAIIGSSQTRLDPADFFSHKPNKIILEIGFGGGEFIINNAKDNPDFGYIGSEPYLNGIASLLSKIDSEVASKDHNISPLSTNIRIYPDDSRKLLYSLMDNSLDAIYVLFPDPWRKTRHYKRRIINQEFLELGSHILKPGGVLLIVTDHNNYASWISRNLTNNLPDIMVWENEQSFFPQAALIKTWQKTRYQQKAEEQGKAINFFLVRKI